MYDDEERYLQEQENSGGQQTDLFDVVDNVRNINDKIKQSKLKNAGDGGVNVDPKAGAEVTGKAAESGVTSANTAGTTASTAGSTAAATGAEGAAAAGGTATAGGTAAATGATAAAGGTAAAAAGTGAVAATPVGWIILAVILVTLLIIIIVVLFGSAGAGLGEGSGLDQDLLVQSCDPNSELYEECKEITDYLNGVTDLSGQNVSGLRSRELFNKMIDYCDKAQPFGQKLFKYITQQFADEELIIDGCDLAKVIEKYVSKKEEDTGVILSRGLVVSTLQQLYNVGNNEKDIAETEKDSKMDSSKPNSVLANIAANGLVSVRDIKSIVEYMVTNTEYTYFKWTPHLVDTRYQCRTVPDGNGGWKEVDCKKKIEFRCDEETYQVYSADSEKYFRYLRFGGSYVKDTVGNVRWNYPLVYNKSTNEDKLGDYIKNALVKFYEGLFQGVFKWFTGMVITIDFNGNVLGDVFDPATSYQEIDSFNQAVRYTSNECKIRGEAENSKPEDTEDTVYVVKTSSVGNALEYYADTEEIDLSGYEKEPEELTKPVEVPALLSNCGLNHRKKSQRCNPSETMKPLSYANGFIAVSFPGYSKEDLKDEEYKILSTNVEKMVKIIDEQEDFINEIFGFGNGYGNFSFSSENACLKYDSYKIRLRTCSNTPKDVENMTEFPGGAELSGSYYVAKETISMDEYLLGATYAENGKLFYEDKKELLKFQITQIKSYFLSKNPTETNGEILVPVGSACAQNFTNPSKIAARYVSVFQNAYSEVRNILLYTRDSNNIFRAEYRSNTQLALQDQGTGLNYEELLDLMPNLSVPSTLSEKEKEKFISVTRNYSNAKYNMCSGTTELGTNFVENALKFVTGGSCTSNNSSCSARTKIGGWMNIDFIKQYKSYCDFRSGSAWCARFVNLIKELTPGAKEKIGNVPGCAGVTDWMNYFANDPKKTGLRFYSSQHYYHVGYWSEGNNYKYANGKAYVPKPGDLIIYSLKSPWGGNAKVDSNESHIGIIVDIYKNPKNGKTCIKSVEGNVSGQGSNDASSVQIWDCHYYVESPTSDVAGYGVWQ